MRTLDVDGNELNSIDESLGYTTVEKRFVAHHDAVEPVTETWHYEVEKEYPNGGRLLRKVVDIPGVETKEAWDEYEEVYVFHPYPIDDVDDAGDMAAANDNEPTQLDRIEAQIMYTALMTDTLLEE